MHQGRKTYTAATELYGTPKTTNVTEKPNQGASPAVTPMMKRFDVQTQGIDAMRADYQARASTPSARAVADRSMVDSGVSVRNQPVAAAQRGAASIEADPMSYKRKDPVANQDLLKQHQSALDSLGKQGMNDSDYKTAQAAPKAVYDRGSDLDKALMGGQSTRRVAEMDTPRAIPVAQGPRLKTAADANAKVVSTRPLTAKDRKKFPV